MPGLRPARSPLVTRRRERPLGSLVVATLLALLAPLEALPAMDPPLARMPDGFFPLHVDDGGADGCHPHIGAAGSALFAPGDVDGDERARTVSWDWKGFPVVYEGLDPERRYIIAVTYANERFNERVQTLRMGGSMLHGAHALPRGGVERLLFEIPPEAVAGGVLRLEFGLERGPNAVVSAVELWTDAPVPPELHLVGLAGLYGPLSGRVVSGTREPAAGVRVALRAEGDTEVLAEATTEADGRFALPRAAVEAAAARGDARVEATDGSVRASAVIPREDLAFEPVRYVPIPAELPGAGPPSRLLDGTWRLRTEGVSEARRLPLTADGWCPIEVPGQWAQQGFEIDPAQPVAVATVFEAPAAWADMRVFLRFDAVHGGVEYSLNGRRLGRSERLFTPVEWEITDHVRLGAANRLDLAMVAETLSEQLSHSSGYAFHSLAGIDRSVRIYAVPRTHVATLRLRPELDEDLRSGSLGLEVGLMAEGACGRLALEVELRDGAGQAVAGSPLRIELRPPPEGLSQHAVRLGVAAPRLWSAEKPNLYAMRLSLREGGRVLETIERAVGFRRIEVRGSELLVNGRAVKLAGGCRHEIDPLTGRTATARWAEEDVRLMKAANLNMIRTAHYPPTRELLDAADRIGMYVEVEAPFCWVGAESDPSHLRAYLDPTSAMVDACHDHPSVLLWSIANESAFNPLFEVSAQLVRDLDPTRPRTFNYPDPKAICEIANLHYPPRPYDDQLPGDPRPILLGEYNFPICHEQTDVMIDPGLRELWGAGQADPGSEWADACARDFHEPYMQPGMPPGTWEGILDSRRVIGGDIWAFLDDTFYLPGGRSVGYSWHHGFWGLIDAWRRPKPEWWLAKMIYSPIRFPHRTLPFEPGQRALAVPVGNRYAFTDLSELRLTWQLGKAEGTLSIALAPGEDGTLTVPLPPLAAAGDELVLRAFGPDDALVTAAAITLGARRRVEVPAAAAGAPAWRRVNGRLSVEGDGFAFALDERTGRILSHGETRVRLRAFPQPHVTRFDFGDLIGQSALPYAVLPPTASRTIEEVRAEEADGALEITVRDRYENFAGTTVWRLDRAGHGAVRYDYAYSGEELPCREIGTRVLVDGACEELRWRRWSEWGDVYPEDSISRTVGRASAHRDPALGLGGHRLAPAWPWALDETEQGTADFRGVKLNVYEAALTAPDGRGLRLRADADAHVRAALSPEGTWLHLLSTCRIAPVRLRPGERVAGSFAVELVR